MNYLQLVQRLWMESGASGASPGPSTVVNQTGEYARLVTWINAAWQDIQTAHKDWGWMRATASFTTVAGQGEYTLGSGSGTVGVTAATHGMWARNTGRVYVTSVGTNSESFLDGDIDYDEWRDTYQFGANRVSSSRPNVVAISPAKSLCFGPVTAAGYTVTHDYFTAPVDLAADADIPGAPAHFHMAIVWRALMMYGAFESASEVYDRGELEFGKLMRRMNADRVPEITFAGALA